MTPTTMQDRIDRDLMTVDQKIAKLSAIEAKAVAERTEIQHTRRALLAAAVALRGETV